MASSETAQVRAVNATAQRFRALDYKPLELGEVYDRPLMCQREVIIGSISFARSVTCIKSMFYKGRCVPIMDCGRASLLCEKSKFEWLLLFVMGALQCESKRWVRSSIKQQ